MTKDMFDSFRKHLADVHAELELIEIAYNALNEQIVKLEKQGIIHASPHWKDGRYLVLVHPEGAFTKMVDGNVVPYRKREYIGVVSAKTVEALAKIDRYAAWDKLSKKRDQLQRRMDEFNSHMGCFLREMKWLKKQTA